MAVALFCAAVMGLLTIPGVAAQDETNYDRDNDGLIEVADLAQLNAIRWDLDGDGAADDAANEADYAAAFPDPATGMGCPSTGCIGYELTANLNFHGSTWASDPGWAPLAEYVDTASIPFTATFDGNGKDITNLYINRPAAFAVGLFGYVGASGDIRNVRLHSVNVTGQQYVGGLVGLNSGGTVSNSQAAGDVTGMDAGTANGQIVGGLVGYNYGGTISDSHASGTVTGHQNIGGLVGYNYGDISDSHASGSVSGEQSIGGLAGVNYGVTISNSHATGRVTGTGTSKLIGGLVGYNSGTISDNSYATGAVTGDSQVGGLVGMNEDGTISTSHAKGDVTGTDTTINSGRIGGLVGDNHGDGTISDNSYATGAVRGHREVGGLVGENTGAISTSHATGDVTGTETTFRSTQIGGLVGLNYGEGSIRASYATGTVTGSESSGEYTGEHAGGLVGANQGGTIDASLSTGTVIGSDNIGGLVGANINSPNSIGTISTSYSTGSVTGTREVGGLVGVNYAAIRASYSTATVRAADGSAGGLVGANIRDTTLPDDPTGTIRASYSKGTVTGTTDVGGLVGQNDGGTIGDSYWDTDTSGVTTSAGGTGKTTEELQTPTDYTDSDPDTEDIYADWNLDLDGDNSPDDPWDFGTDSQYPALKIDVVIDVNEPPEIGSGSRTEFSYRENGAAALYTYRATDPEQAAIAWSLTGPDDGDFAIGETGALSFASPPDYENPADAGSDNVYNVTVVASDDRGNRDTLDIIVTVTDQDEAPEVAGQQSLSFTENQTTGRILATYTATDPEDPSAIITRWSLTGSDGGDFEINENGELSFRNIPDYEKPADSGKDNVYDFSVRASDGRNYGYLEVTVTVTDVNEPPEITTTSSSATELRQNEKQTPRLYTYRATDPEQAAIAWSLTGADAGDFAIGETGALSFASPPDYENPADAGSDNVYNVTVVATDDRGLTDELDVIVTVTDTITVPENSDQTIAVYTATDPEDPSAIITRWSLTGSDGGDFEINENGELSFRNIPDYERPADSGKDNVYDFSVRASDGRNYGYLPITVTVTDVNEPPEIGSGSRTEFSYRENGAAALYTYKATDPEQAAIVWSLTGADDGDFAIGETGALSFASPPDHENPADAGSDNVYNVTVVASDAALNSSTLEVTVTVTDQNEGPQVSGQQSLSFTENQTTDRVLATYSGVDPEDPSAAITRWSLTGADAGDFEINENGELSFRNIPNHEKPADSGKDNVYDFSVRASDGRNYGYLPITVTVTDVNEPPEIGSGSRTEFSYRENGAAALYTYKATDPEQAAIVWSLTGADDGDFAIGETGALSFASPPDHENPADAGSDNVYNVTVVATDDRGLTDELDVTVTVTDQNEGPQVSGQQSLSFTENQTTDRVLATYSGVDPEDPSAAITRWSLTGADAGDFEINENGELSFRNIPNHEKPADSGKDNVYDFSVRASDGRNYGYLPITVTVTDVNEPPEIGSGSRTEFSYRENGAAALYTYKATDPEQAAIVWSLTGADDGDFAIGETGALSFASPPDHENPADAGSDNVYNVTVVASDAALNSSTLEVTVTVTDQNEGPQVSGQQSLSFTENQTTDRVLATYSGVDPEDPSAAITRWSLTGADAGDFEINENGELSFRNIPNHEKPADSGKDNVYDFSVRASDGRNYGYLPITVTVTDVNEPPEIGSGSRTEFSYRENGAAALYTYKATDPEQAAIVWSLTGADDGDFAIGETGALSFASPPDHENPADAGSDNVYNVTVVASDAALNSSTLEVTVTVTDQNEGPQVSGQQSLSFTENQTTDRVLATYSGVDPEDPSAAITRWSLTGADAGDFEINENGELSFRNIPNHEKPADSGKDNVYDFSVRASDGRNYGYLPITVTVTDVNEPPEIGSGSRTEFSYRENGAAALYTYKATDPEQAAIVWSLTGADDGDFAIGETGALSFASPPDHENPADAGSDNVYNVTVVASDAALNSSTLEVTVTVTDQNEGPQVSGQQSLSFTENQTTDRVLATYSGVDPEDPSAAITRWSLTGADAGDFEINENGELSFRNIPNHEKPADSGKDNVYDFSVRASDGRNYGYLPITVTVTDVNEPPEIGSGSRTEFSYRENGAAALYTYKATDPEQAAIVWSLTGADDGDFAIGETGALSFASPPDHENPADAGSDNVYNVTVVATDDRGLTDELDVTVTVTDQNEGPQVSGQQSLSFTENQTTDRVLATYSGVDPEDPSAAITRWSLTGADAGDFEINENGELSFRNIPNHEKPADSGKDNVYDFSVRASDGRNYGYLPITVTVTDVNEPPEIGSGSRTEFSYRENGAAALYTYKATDPEQAAIVWSLTGADDGDFAIGETGALSFASPPDHENPADAGSDNVYNVTVVATDDRGLTDELDVTVTVTDQNEGPQVSGQQSLSFTENQTTDRVLATYSGVDPEDPSAAITRWSLTGADAGDFEINENGELSFRNIPNHEKPADSGKDNVYDFSVRASDGRNYGYLPITVTVTDVNEPPEIGSGSRTEFSYRENATAALYTYKATDPEQAAIVWSLTGADDGDFAIGETGALSFASPPDHENPADAGSDNVYNVTVVATDDRGLTDELDVTVTVTDQNEGPQVSGQQSLSFTENQTTDRVLATYSGVDPEDPSAAITRWSLTGADAGDFEINENGELSFRNIPNHEKPADSGKDNVYDFSVRASDGRNYGYLPITVTVTDVNEPPEIGSGSRTEFSYRENATAALYTYKATDPEQAAIVWSLTGADDGDFAIGETGALSFASPPDHENPADAGSDNVYNVTVVASDAALNSSTLEVTVTVTDQNEGPEVSVISTFTRAYGNPTDAGTVHYIDGGGNRESRTSEPTAPVARQAGSNSPATGQPTVTGTARVGETLSADTSGSADEDGLDHAAFSFQWVANDGSADSDIPGATASIYTPTDANVGKTIKMRVSFTDDAGNEETLTSAPTEPVEVRSSASREPEEGRPNTPATGLPTISGTAQVGETLTAGTSDISDAEGLTNATFSYQWLADDAAIAGASGSTYTLAAADEGKAIKVQVSFTDAAGNDETLTSEATDAVAAAPQPNSPATGAPTISGTARVGETLTTNMSGIADEDGLSGAAFSYQWVSSDGTTDTDIRKATDSTYKLVADDEGKAISVRVSFTDDSGTKETLTSAATEQVLGDGPPGVPGKPAITAGDRELTLSWEPPGDNGSAPAKLYRIEWRRDGQDYDTNQWTTVDETTYTVPNLANGISYTVRVKARNDNGYGPPSEEASGTPTSGSAVDLDTPVLSEPEILHHRMVKLDWQDIEGADSYEVQFYNNDDEWVELPADDVEIAVHGSSAVVSNLDGGLTWLRVRAVSCAGASEWSQIEELYGTNASDWEDVPVPTVEEGDEAEPCPEDLDPPDNSPATGAATISGTAEVGETLTADTSGIEDADGLTNATFRYQWLAAETAIQGAMGSTYTLEEADVGKTIGVRVSFTDDEGNEETLTSAPTDAVAAATQPNNPATGAPTINGTAQMGETLTADTSGIADADGLANAVFSYQWVSSDGTTDTDIQDATGSIYTLAAADEGKAIKVRVSFTDDAGNEETLTSTPTDAVAAVTQPNSPATGAPTINGTAQLGETLTTNTSGIADENGLENVTFSYQWLAADTAIQDATGSTYTLEEADEGKTIGVRVSFSDDAGNEETLTSAPTDAVAAATPLTASFENVPGTHNGTADFTFELRFSEEFAVSFRTLRDAAFEVTGGSVTGAQRLVQGSNIGWKIHVRPDSDADVTVVLPATSDCGADGAICTADDKPLSNRLEETISGPSE